MNRKILSILLFVTLLFACEKPPQEIPVSSVSLNQATAEMIVGETVQLSALKRDREDAILGIFKTIGSNGIRQWIGYRVSRGKFDNNRLCRREISHMSSDR